MDGVIEINQHDNVKIFIIEYLSEDLKIEIKNQINFICHGDKININRSIYSLQSTIKDLKDRYPNDPQKQKGFIGELLVNVLVRTFMTNFSIVSPFFNKEERASAKKGFDVVLRDSEDCNMWIIESKSGTVSEKLDVNKKIKERLSVAKTDLKDRLSKSDNYQLWKNAINDVEICMHDGNEKQAFLDILNDSYENPNTLDKNVILVGTVFHNVKDQFDSNEIITYHQSCERNKCFNHIKIIAIQKNTYEKVYKYLESLV